MTRRVVAELLAVRKNLGLIQPGPQQVAMAAALADDAHAVEQRARYAARRTLLRVSPRGAPASGSTTPRRPSTSGPPATRTAGTPSPTSPGSGILVAPGTFYGARRRRHVRVALTATDERVAAAAGRLASVA